MKTNVFQKTARIILGISMTFAGFGHLTFQREEFQAQVPRWLPDNPAFMDIVVISSGIVEILLGLSIGLARKSRTVFLRPMLHY